MPNTLGGQLFQLEAYDVEQFGADRAMNATGTTNAVNVTETGILLSIGLYKSVGWSGSPTMFLEIQVDGGTTRQIQISSASTNFYVDTQPYYVSDGTSLIGLRYDLGVRYQTSLRVGLNVTVGGSAGTTRLLVIKGMKL